MAKINPKISTILIVGLLVRILLGLISAWHPDLNNHIDWGLRFLSYGSQRFYEESIWGVSWPNQPFGSILLFAFVAIVKNTLFSFIMFLNNSFGIFPSFIVPILESQLHGWLVKAPFILADIGIGYLIYKIVSEFKPKIAVLASAIFLFNPVIIYNSTIWGQTDSLINLLALAGFYFTFKKKYFWGINLFLASFLFKLSLIIYLPIFGLLLIKQIKNWKKFILPTTFFIAFIFCLAIHFAFGDKTPIEWVWYMYTNRVLPRQGSMLNGNAFNFWAMLFSIDLSKSEFTVFMGLTYQTWSRLITLLFFIPVWVKFLRSKLSLYNLFFSLFMTGFISFMFLTNMHERYLYPIFPLLTMLLFFPKTIFKSKLLIGLSVIHLLNLYNLWFYPQINFLKALLIASNYTICRVFSFILLIVCLNYFVKLLTSENK